MKYLVLILFQILTVTVYPQSQVTISGTVTEGPSGFPVAFHPVYLDIAIDSSIVIHDSVLTDLEGFYGYNFVLTGFSARIDISTPDCNGTVQSYTWFASANQTQIVQDFELCETTICQAFFIYEQSSDFTFQFFDQSVGQGLSYYWTFGDDTFSLEQNPSHSYNYQGVFEVCLIISSPDSTCLDVYCTQVITGGGPGCLAQFTYFPDSLQSGLSYQFLDLSSGNIDSWSWDFGDGSFSQEQNPVHTFPVEGTYEVCLSISGPECQGTWCEMVTISTAGDCYNFFTYQAVENTVNFQGSHFPTIPATYSWDFGDGTTGEGPLINHTYTGNGVYYVSLLTSDSEGCTAISSQSVVVGDTILFNQVYGQVFEGYLPMSAGQVMIASVQSNPGFEPYMDVAEVDSMGVFVFPYVPYGQYTLYAIPANQNGYLPTYYGGAQHWTEASAITSMESGMLYTINLAAVNTTPVLGSGTITGFIADNLLRSEMLQFTQVMLYSSSWQSLGFTTVNPDGSFSFQGLAMDLYYIFPELPGIHSNYIAVEITDLSPTSAVYLEFDGTSILGTEETEEVNGELKIYPNPAVEFTRVFFSLSKPGTVTIQIADLAGRVHFSNSYQGKSGLVEISVSLSDLEPGVYLLMVSDDKGRIGTGRLIKQ